MGIFVLANTRILEISQKNYRLVYKTLQLPFIQLFTLFLAKIAKECIIRC